MRLIFILFLIASITSHITGQVCTPDANIGNLQQQGLSVGPILSHPIVGSALPSCRTAIVTAVWVNNSDFCFEDENDAHNAFFRITLPSAFLGATGTIMISASDNNTYWDTPTYIAMSNTYSVPIMGAIPPNVAITITISGIQVAPATPIVFASVLAQLTTAVTDANASDNDASVNFFIAQTAGPNIDMITPNCIGNNAAINLSVSSGTMPYTYSWAGPNGYTAMVEDPMNLAQPGTYLVTVSDANGCTATGMVDLDGGNCVTLPIDLLEFDAIAIDDEKVLLQWSTASETNNAYFSIQRSKDGLKWTEIAQAKGANKSTTIRHYKDWDKHPHEGVNYYRLQQFDNDGASSFSPIRAAVIKGSGAFSAVLYPNPGVDKFYIQLNNATNKSYVINIYNPIGMRMPTSILREEGEEGGYTIDAQAYPAGYYQVLIIDEKGTVVATLPMIKK